MLPRKVESAPKHEKNMTHRVFKPSHRACTTLEVESAPKHE